MPNRRGVNRLDTSEANYFIHGMTENWPLLWKVQIMASQSVSKLTISTRETSSSHILINLASIFQPLYLLAFYRICFWPSQHTVSVNLLTWFKAG